MDQLIIIRTTSLLSTLCLPYFSHLCVTSCFTKILFIRKAHLFFDLPSYFLKGFLMFYLQQILHIFKQITLLISRGQGYVFRLVVHNSYLYNSFRMKMSFLFCFFFQGLQLETQFSVKNLYPPDLYSGMVLQLIRCVQIF